MAKKTSAAKAAKYKAHPVKAIANALRKRKKHVKKHPNDLQTAKLIEGK